MSGFDKPNFTMTPNMLFDELMKDMSEAELKVTLAIVRKTFGYHKQRDQISLTQLEELTGLSRRACVDGVEAVIKRGLVQRGEAGKRGITTFELVINNDQLQFVTSSSDNMLPVTSDNLKHTKETGKETPQKKQNAYTAPSGTGTSIPPAKKVSKEKKPSKYTPEENNVITAIFEAWYVTAEIIGRPGLCNNATCREQAYKFYKMNITPELIKTYINNLRLDRYWRDKGISWNKVCAEIVPYLKSRHLMPDAIIAKTAITEIEDDQPTEPVANPVLFGGQHEPAA